MEYIFSVTGFEVLKGFISYINERKSNEVAEKYIHFSGKHPLKSHFSENKGFIKLMEYQLHEFFQDILNCHTPEVLFEELKEKAFRYVDEGFINQPGIALLQSFKVLEKSLQSLVEEYSPEPLEQLTVSKALFSFFNDFEIALFSSEKYSILQSKGERKLTENLVKNSIDGILVFDHQLTIMEFNPALENLTGIGREDAIGRRVYEIMPHLTETGEIRFYHQVLKGLSLMVPEVKYSIPVSGRNGYYNSSYTPIISSTGTVSGGLVVIHEITKRKQIEEKLRQQKQFSESLINNSIDGVFAFNQYFKCTAWNPQMEMVTGILKSNALGCSVEDLINKDTGFNIESLTKVLDGEILFFEEFKFSKNNQQFEVFIMPVYNPDKSITGGLVIVHNITERTKAEEALRELSESLKHTVEGIAMVNTSGKFISANKAVGKLASINLKDLPNKYWYEVIDEEDLEMGYQSFEKVKTESSASFEARIKSNKAFAIYSEITIVPYHDRIGELKGYHLFFRDISERKLVENRLKRSEALLIEAQELARLGSFEYDPINQQMAWSDEVFRIFGLKPKEIKPDLDAFYSLLSEDAKDIMTSTWDKVLSTYKPSNFEHKVKVPGKLARVVYGHAKPVINVEGQIVKISGYLQDITERKEAEKILKEAYEELKMAEENLVKINTKLENRVKQRTEELSRKNEELKHKNDELLKINSDLDNFVYTASHDLKSPISNIEGLINTLSDELTSSKNQDFGHLIDMINISINKFKTTIKDLTEITKIQKNIDEEVSLISIDDLIEEVKYDVKPLLQNEQAEFLTDLQVPDIRFSRKNLRSILYNLISNAIKYRSTERTPAVTLRTELLPGYVLLTVKDNGLGIELQQKDKIFRMFKRMHTHVEGTGIGLYIVKRIIENSGGKIEVESEVGKGTEFRVYLKTKDK